MSRLLLVGVTGLVGQALLQQAVAEPRVTRIVALSRRPLPADWLAAHPQVHNPVVDFEALPEQADWWSVDAVVCALGTTIAQAGSQVAFRRVDQDYVLAVARLARAHGATCFALNSALGADPSSQVFYNRVKGAVEQQLLACGYPSVILVRPSLLGGQRAKVRPAEAVSIILARALRCLIPRRYRVVPATRVAAALLASALQASPGVQVIESDALQP